MRKRLNRVHLVRELNERLKMHQECLNGWVRAQKLEPDNIEFKHEELRSRALIKEVNAFLTMLGEPNASTTD